jgi:hypothetical protein
MAHHRREILLAGSQHVEEHDLAENADDEQGEVAYEDGQDGSCRVHTG